MANEKILNTRIQLKYDSYENWQKSTITLKTGEIAIAYLGPTKTTAELDNGTHPVLMKVGPGLFKDLPWMSALAADVHAWAKQASLPIVRGDTEGKAEGNVISGIKFENDQIVYTTASVATSEGMEELQEAVEAIEKDISDSRAAWLANDNTTYTFSKNGKTLTITPSKGTATPITFEYLT